MRNRNRSERTQEFHSVPSGTHFTFNGKTYRKQTCTTASEVLPKGQGGLQYLPAVRFYPEELVTIEPDFNQPS